MSFHKRIVARKTVGAGGSSDRFSTYLLAYEDKAATDGSGKPVKTGDDSHAGLMLLIAAASLTVLAGMGIARRRRGHQH